MGIILDDLTFLYYNLISIFHDYIHDCTRQGSGTARLNVGLKKFHDNYVMDQSLTIFGGGKKNNYNQKGGVWVKDSEGINYNVDPSDLKIGRNQNGEEIYFSDSLRKQVVINKEQNITPASPDYVGTSFSPQSPQSPNQSQNLLQGFWDPDEGKGLGTRTDSGTDLDLDLREEPQAAAQSQSALDAKIFLRDVCDNIKLMFFGYGDWCALHPAFYEIAHAIYKNLNSKENLFEFHSITEANLIIYIWETVSNYTLNEASIPFIIAAANYDYVAVQYLYSTIRPDELQIQGINLPEITNSNDKWINLQMFQSIIGYLGDNQQQLRQNFLISSNHINNIIFLSVLSVVISNAILTTPSLYLMVTNHPSNPKYTIGTVQDEDFNELMDTAKVNPQIILESEAECLRLFDISLYYHFDNITLNQSIAKNRLEFNETAYKLFVKLNSAPLKDETFEEIYGNFLESIIIKCYYEILSIHFLNDGTSVFTLFKNDDLIFSIVDKLIKMPNYFESVSPTDEISGIISRLTINYQNLKEFLKYIIKSYNDFSILDLLSDAITETITSSYYPSSQSQKAGAKSNSMDDSSTNNMIGGKLTGQQWSDINGFIDGNTPEWVKNIQTLMIRAWNSAEKKVENPLNASNPNFYMQVLKSIFDAFPDITEKDKKTLEKSFKNGGSNTFSTFPVNTTNTVKRTHYDVGGKIPPELEKLTNEAILQLNNCLKNFKKQLDVLRAQKTTSSVKSITDKKDKLPDYPGLEDDIIVFNNVTKMVATAGLMAVGFIDSDANILPCPYQVAATGVDPAPSRWRGITSELLKMEIDILFKEVVSNQYRIFDDTNKLPGSNLDERLELAIKRIYGDNNRVVIGDSAGRDDINTLKNTRINPPTIPQTYSQAIFSNNSAFFTGTSIFEVPSAAPQNYKQPAIYIDNALQNKNPSLFDGQWPNCTLCNVPGFIDGWDAQCAWSTCDNPQNPGQPFKVKELPVENGQLNFEISTPSGGQYTSILQRTSSTPNGLIINMNTTLQHLGQPFGFICPDANITSSSALEATRVYDKQLQILLFKFQQYRDVLKVTTGPSVTYSNLFKLFLTDATTFSTAGNEMPWKDGSGTDVNGNTRNPFVHFAEYGLWKACADNSIISSAVHGQNGVYNVVQPLQSIGGISGNFQNPLQKDRTMIQAGTDRPAQMGQVVAIYLNAQDGSYLNENLLIGNNSSTENSYFYVLPRKMWPLLPPGQAGGRLIKNKKSIRGKKNKKLKTIRKYKKALKYNSYRKSSTKNKKIYKSNNSVKNKKKIVKKYSRRSA